MRVAVGASLVGLNTLIHVPLLLLIALLKALLPFRSVRNRTNRLLVRIAESWTGVNTFLLRKLTFTRIVVEEDAVLRRDGHYLVLANHQSWVDIPVLQSIFNRRIPLLRFFLKSQLFWVPLLGLAWWALDFPFMKRYSREHLAKRPELAGRDVEATRRACAKFRDIPVAIMNFAEGTRFSAGKHAGQCSPFANLLKPKAGGVAFVLNAMGEGLHAILDVTLVYPRSRPRIVDLLSNRIPEVRVHIRERPIPREFINGDYQHDAAFRERLQVWINELWLEKDATIGRLLTPKDSGA
jgi:1-acyl-sn-glycerol-3-phosphate acyltransferase